MQQRIYLSEFNHGMNSTADVRALPPGACSDGENLRLCDNSIKVREGRAFHADLPGESGAATMLIEYRRAGASQQQLAAGFDDDDGPGLLLARGESLYYASNANEQQVFEVVDGLTLDTGQRTRAAQYKALVYLVDGKSPVRSWSPTGIKILADRVKPLNAPAPAAIVGAARQLADTSTGEVSGKNSGYFREGDDYKRQVNAANSVLWIAEPLFGKAGKNGAEFRACYCRQFNAQADADEVLKPMMGMEIISNQAEVEGTFDFSARMMISLSPEVSNVVLPQATMIETRFKVVCGGDVLPAVSFQLGTERTALQAEEPDMTISIDLDLADEVPNSWITKQLTLDGLYTPTLLRSMKLMAFDVDCIGAVTATAARLEMTADTVRPDNDYAVTLLLDYIAVDVADSKFTPGAAYEFCYSYGWENAAGVMLYSAASPISASFDVGGSVYNLTMAISVPCEIMPIADYGADNYPVELIIYARGGNIGTEFHQIAITDLTTLLNYQEGENFAQLIDYSWDGMFDNSSGVNLLPSFTPAPVDGCSLIAEHRGRMCYAKGDVLYLSNWDAPEKVPGEDSIAQASTDGTWVRVGLDGSPIVGLGKLGSYLVIFKMRSCWMLEGDDLATFTLVQLSETHGCSSHESIAQLDGTMLVWRDGEHIWAWDGQQFSDIGLPIRKLLQAHSIEQQMNSISCFNPAERLYLLTVPGSAALSAVSYPFEMKSGCWNPPWTTQPGNALCYAQTIAVAGLYAADAAGVFRLFSGTVDAIDGASTQAIHFSWVSGAIEQPFPGRCKDVRAIHAVMSYADSLQTVDFGLRVNGASSERITKQSVPVKPLSGSPGVATWLPKPLSDIDAFTVRISGNTNAGGEIVRLELLIASKGGSR